jgi:hypothetical protein
MVRFAVVCAGVMALAMAGCAKEPAEQEAPANAVDVPPPPLTTEMVGGSDPAVQPAVAPTQPPAAAPGAAPQGAPTTSPTTPAPATAAPATADTSHAAHADSGHTCH